MSCICYKFSSSTLSTSFVIAFSITFILHFRNFPVISNWLFEFSIPSSFWFVFTSILRSLLKSWIVFVFNSAKYFYFPDLPSHIHEYLPWGFWICLSVCSLSSLIVFVIVLLNFETWGFLRVILTVVHFCMTAALFSKPIPLIFHIIFVYPLPFGHMYIFCWLYVSDRKFFSAFV